VARTLLFAAFEFAPTFRGQECPRHTTSHRSIAQERFVGRRWRQGGLGRRRLRLQQRQLPLRQPRFVFIVGANDALHQVMTDHVAFVEMNERQPVHALQNLGRFDEAAAAGGGQVDLRDVAGDHSFRTKAEASHEHLHLLGSGVLGLVEDDEGIVEGASAHEGDGRNLDDVLL